MQHDMLDDYSRHSPFTDPGVHRERLDALPNEVPGLCHAIQGLIVHYRASGIPFPPERLREIDTRFVSSMLERLVTRDPAPLNEARAPEERLVGCCRDFATLFVSVMRERGVSARARVGFAPYLHQDFHTDHVIAEVWNGERWVWVDPQMQPEWVPFDPHDMPASVFITASEAWRRYRQGTIDPDTFGVAPELLYRGAWFIRNYVLQELAALNGHEMLLWDQWARRWLSSRVRGRYWCDSPCVDVRAYSVEPERGNA